MELFALRELAAALTESDKPGRIIASMINPGTVRTNFHRHMDGFQYYMAELYPKLAGRTPEVAGRILVSACEAGQESHGQYLDDCKVGQ
jgi:retinol dehydrogenase-12